jgi:ribokinase
MNARVGAQVPFESPRIAVVGGCGIGLTMGLQSLPNPGETVTDGLFSRGPGGKGSNQAIAARRLGAEVELLTIVGPDEFGDELRALWRNEGVGHAAVVTGARPTMIGFILVGGQGENCIAIAPGALDELTAEVVTAFVERTAAREVLLVSLEIPVAAAVAGLHSAKLAGATTVLNPAPARTLPTESWSTIDHLIPNRSEAASLTGLQIDSPIEALLDELRRLFRGTIILTLGAAGVAVDVDGRRERIGAATVSGVVDTTGAGDAFSAAYAVALTEGGSVVESARFAAVAGAFTTTQAEVVPALPAREDLIAFADSRGLAGWVMR